MGCPLSVRQFQCLAACNEGLTTGEIAERYGCAASTIRTHLKDACKRIGAARRADALIVARREGWFKRPAYPDWPELTPAQRFYLAAFDRYLKTGSLKDRVDMRLMLDHMRDEQAARRDAA